MNCVLMHSLCFDSLLTPLSLNPCIPSFHLHLLLLWALGPPSCLLLLQEGGGASQTYATPALSDPRPTFKQCAGWIWVMSSLGGAVRFQERRHKSLLCSQRNENGDNSEEIMRSVSACVCVWWALFMKLYCTNNPKQCCASLTTKIHHKLPKVVQIFLEQNYSSANIMGGIIAATTAA